MARARGTTPNPHPNRNPSPTPQPTCKTVFKTSTKSPSPSPKRPTNPTYLSFHPPLRPTTHRTLPSLTRETSPAWNATREAPSPAWDDDFFREARDTSPRLHPGRNAGSRTAADVGVGVGPPAIPKPMLSPEYPLRSPEAMQDLIRRGEVLSPGRGTVAAAKGKGKGRKVPVPLTSVTKGRVEKGTTAASTRPVRARKGVERLGVRDVVEEEDDSPAPKKKSTRPSAVAKKVTTWDKAAPVLGEGEIQIVLGKADTIRDATRVKAAEAARAARAEAVAEAERKGRRGAAAAAAAGAAGGVKKRSLARTVEMAEMTQGVMKKTSDTSQHSERQEELGRFVRGYLADEAREKRAWGEKGVGEMDTSGDKQEKGKGMGMGKEGGVEKKKAGKTRTG